MKFRLVILSAAALSGCSSSTGEPASDPVALVKLAPVMSGGVASSLEVYGAVEQGADTQYTLSAPVEGIVSSVAASPGAALRRGQLVVRLRPSPATQAQIASLAADARSAGDAYARAKRLRADGLVSDADVESARAAAAAAQASRKAIADQSGQLSLRSPGSGYVQSIASNPGELVSAGATIATISRNGDLRARFGIDPLSLKRLSRGAGIVIAGDSGSVTAPIASVDPSIDPQTRLASIYALVPSSAGAGVGEPLKGSVTLEQSGNAITVPYAALLDDGGQPYVFTVASGVAHRQDVTVGASNSSSAAITSGLKPGQQVVIAGGTALEDGVKVRTK